MKDKSDKNLDNLIQKSRPLLNLWRSDFEISEFKLLDLYLSKINSDKPENRTLVIEKGKVEEIFGVTRLRKESLFPQLEKLQTTKVSLSKDANEYNSIILFSQATAKKDEYGEWIISLTCSPEAMKYIFNLKEIGYIKYRLKCITQLSRTSSYILFNYLENYIQSRKQAKSQESISWSIELDELKQMLRCDTVKSYEKYKEFNSKVLKKCHEEINAKTSLKYDYMPYRRSKLVAGITFTVYCSSVINPLLNTEESKDVELTQEQKVFVKTEEENLTQLDNGLNSIIEILSEACENEFNGQEVEELFSLISVIPKSSLPVLETDDVTLRRESYLSQKYCSLKNYAKKTTIKNRFAYLKKIIQNDLEDLNIQAFSTKKDDKKEDDLLDLCNKTLYSEYE